ncbi:MAG: hypothetical protein EOO65_00405 [Methanosarcinales archaeon]|nr:MAG: hypothetical protein EOO65_00405 [Methanosarcinales archaeon]
MRLQGSTKVPTGRYTQVSVGGSGTVCALQANAQDMRCWGAALIRRRKAVHAALQRHDAYLQVATADQAVCGVLANGELDCFGNVAALWHRTPPPTPAELVLQLSIQYVRQPSHEHALLAGAPTACLHLPLRVAYRAFKAQPADGQCCNQARVHARSSAGCSKTTPRPLIALECTPSLQ